ncbi:hypothetical protein DPEC_G00341610 [Dallia pectoralis]|uniref:Uncharacterized protein n=1 Tax=Dallia pectoralis TaxID=75939 RepID=A0ACC2F5F6_DALPE|nr:hypothetical protein DPEC_G00341610 [Dallia pectoralis]
MYQEVGMTAGRTGSDVFGCVEAVRMMSPVRMRLCCGPAQCELTAGGNVERVNASAPQVQSSTVTSCRPPGRLSRSCHRHPAAVSLLLCPGCGDRHTGSSCLDSSALLSSHLLLLLFPTSPFVNAPRYLEHLSVWMTKQKDRETLKASPQLTVVHTFAPGIF